ncbi:MAG: glucuronate isomerase [Ruminococcaceae bacterium]|nr:glucuronate isomerase [Oscillospiraceae bacterium]
MKTIINDDFILDSETAKELYKIAKDMPIIDYHCHLDPKLIAIDYKFDNLGELFLGGDHYKWRMMRSFGIDEKYVTGNATFKEKFKAFATALQYAIGNPLYHWTHLELKTYFGIDEALTEENADEIYEKCTAMLRTDEFSCRNLIKNSNVKVVCTTDDPVDSLEYHDQIKESGYEVKVLPAFRPDKAVNIHKETFLPYIEKAGVKSYAELKSWLISRLDFFHEKGCRLSDHGLDFVPYTLGDASAIFDKALKGEALTKEEIDAYMTDLLVFFGKEYAKRGWCMQIHVGAIRNNNTKMYKKLGPDTGYDSIAETNLGENLAQLLDTLEMDNALPKTILYSLNPKDNYVLATLMGCFQGAEARGKIQLGSGWWFNDQKDGMEEQLKALGNLGVLGAFVGMLTDSRSFVSYTRHDYFRRILCNLIGEWVEKGLYPNDKAMLEKIIKGISYENANSYFGF